MQALHDWGYTAIPISLLVHAIQSGAPLPERPVVITFDDGDITVYTIAFPIMREFGFVGVNYLVANRLEVEGYMNAAQLQELSAAGWEVGSHSMTHADLRTSPNLDWEIRQSRLVLEAALGLPAETFAYPYGLGNDSESIVEQVRAHYTAAVGLGPIWCKISTGCITSRAAPCSTAGIWRASPPSCRGPSRFREPRKPSTAAAFHLLERQNSRRHNNGWGLSLSRRLLNRQSFDHEFFSP